MSSNARHDAVRNGSTTARRAAERRRWEQLRMHGRSHFIWRYGVAGWGIPAAVVTMLYKLVEIGGLTWPMSLSPAVRQPLIIIAIAFPALGYLFGGWLWTQREERYRRLLLEPDRE